MEEVLILNKVRLTIENEGVSETMTIDTAHTVQEQLLGLIVPFSENMNVYTEYQSEGCWNGN